MTGNTRPKASFGLRLGAALIDGLILVVVTTILRPVVGDTLAEVLGAVLGLAYYVYLEGSGAGQTLGKKVVGIRVVAIAGAGPIGYGRATVRYFGRIVSAIPLGLGYLWMLWDDQKQTWHDKFAMSMVVPVSAYPVGNHAG